MDEIQWGTKIEIIIPREKWTIPTVREDLIRIYFMCIMVDIKSLWCWDSTGNALNSAFKVSLFIILNKVYSLLPFKFILKDTKYQFLNVGRRISFFKIPLTGTQIQILKATAHR